MLFEYSLSSAAWEELFVASFHLYDYTKGRVLIFHEKLRLRGLSCHSRDYTSRGERTRMDIGLPDSRGQTLTTIYTTSLVYK